MNEIKIQLEYLQSLFSSRWQNLIAEFIDCHLKSKLLGGWGWGSRKVENFSFYSGPPTHAIHPTPSNHLTNRPPPLQQKK